MSCASQVHMAYKGSRMPTPPRPVLARLGWFYGWNEASPIGPLVLRVAWKGRVVGVGVCIRREVVLFERRQTTTEQTGAKYSQLRRRFRMRRLLALPPLD